MLARLKFLLYYFFVWIVFFQCARLLFLFYNFSKSKELSFETNALSFLYGLRMDISAASYLLIAVCFFVLASISFPFFRRADVYKIYSYVILFFVLLITVADLEVYKSWGFRIDATPLKYLSSPKEAWASISHLPIFLILFLFCVVYILLCFLFKKFIDGKIYLLKERTQKIATSFVLLLFTAFLIVPIRGGFQLTSMNQSSVYFSKNNFANITAINATWNFLNGLAKGAATKNPYNYLDNKRAEIVIDSLYQSQNKFDTIFKTSKPNVIVIIWESFTEKATHTNIEGIEITPRFNELKKEGIYFSNIYASGDRTDKGLAAVLSGYPALNNVSIIRFPNKSSKLNTLSGFFNLLDYQTSFYYGGETEFANIKSYILQSHFNKLTDKNDFNTKDQNSKWGAHDGIVANKIIDDLSKENIPFFTTWLTLTSHEPFETPTIDVFNGKDITIRFANSLHYTDETLYNFVQQCKQQTWWNNTVLIITADHGHPLIEPSNSIDNFKIPMLWLGGALNKTGIVIDKFASQIDLASSITNQIKPSSNYFPFSKNIFDTTASSWAYFSFNNGFGFVQSAKTFVFDNVGKQIISKVGNVAEKDIEAGKAMQQFTFQDYINK